MTETTTNGKDSWWISTTNTTSTGTVTGSYVYPNIPIDDSNWYGTYTGTYIKSDSESADDIFNRKRMIRTKDSELIELTYAEIYELKRMKKVAEEMTKNEITDVLLVLRI
jgi:hypothetical protein